MPTNVYRCKTHGTKTLEFRAGHPPKTCWKKDCDEPIGFVPDGMRVGFGGDLEWFPKATDRDRRNLGIQLGEIPRDIPHLRELEKKTGAKRIGWGDKKS